MTTAQKRAIYYSYAKKQQARQIATLKKYNLYDDFKQSNYKNITWYLKSKAKQGIIKHSEVYGG